MDKMKIQYIPIEDIKVYENNAKLHPAEQVGQIKKSIEEFGFNDPIALDKDNTIIEGHGRLFAAQELGMTELPCIYLTHMTDSEKKAYILAHNKLNMNTGFDMDILQIELDDIDTDVDMSDFGFTFGSNFIIDPTQQAETRKNTSSELDLDTFGDDNFEHTCPKCGFKFGDAK